MVNIIGITVCVIAFEVVNYLSWRGLSRSRPAGERPWNWRVLLGPFVYYPWMTRQEREN